MAAHGRTRRSSLPSGTLAFLRSDIEGSMGLVRALGARYDELNDVHRTIVCRAVEAHAGQVVRTEGDAFFVVFTDALAAASAAVDIQGTMAAHPWPDGHPLRVRIGLHAGAAHRAGDDYGGFEVNRAARVAAVGWGGQIVISAPARELLGEVLPDGWVVRDLGRHHLRDVPAPEHLYQLEALGLSTAFPPLRTSSGDLDHLPARLTTLVGREAELTTLVGLLEGTRLLTLTGPGGSGKTTLAVELARRQSEGHEDGARFVDLQAVRDPAFVRAEVAHGVGLFDGSTGTAAERLLGYLADRDLLLVLDNFEQVLPAAEVVTDVLRASRRSSIIVTSRVPLRLSGEQEYMVRPLALRPADSGEEAEAVRLFLERARLVRPDLALDDEGLDSIRDTCRLVDGLPLAIELCAARMASLPPRLIHDRLAAHLPLPGSGPRDLPERQRTIDATVAWSYDLIEPPVQSLFARLGAFEETFDLEQAEMACGPPTESGVDVLEGLVGLAEHSLLLRVDDAADGVRFGMLETVRAHALERLQASGQTNILRDRHALAYTLLAEQASEHFPGAEQARWLSRLEADDANLLAATRHAIDSTLVDVALRLVASLWRYWLQTGRLAEGRELTLMALDLPGADARTLVRARALDAAGGIAYWSGDLARATSCYEEELAIATELGDSRIEALAWLDLYFTRQFSEDAIGAKAAIDHAERLYTQLGDEQGLARVMAAFPTTAFALAVDDPHLVLADLATMAARVSGIHDAYWGRVASEINTLASWLAGDAAGAIRWLVHGVRANLAFREIGEAALILQFFVPASLALGRAADGALVHGAVEAAFDRLGIRPPVDMGYLGWTDPLSSLAQELGADALEPLVARGRRLSMEDAVDVVEAAVLDTAAASP